MASSFGTWLTGLLNSNSIDGDVFGEYISGSLETMEDSSQEEIKDTLVELLSGCMEDQGSCESLCQEITEKWLLEKENKQKMEIKTEGLPSSVLVNLAAPVTTREAAAAPAKAPGLSDSEKDRLLAQYGCEEYDDTEELESVPVSAPSRKGKVDSSGFFENVNRSSIVDEQRRLREEQKTAHESKVERDKQNRQAQKQKALDRKEKEKKRTQKQERRR